MTNLPAGFCAIFGAKPHSLKNFSCMSLADQLSPPDNAGLDTKSTSSIGTSHPPNAQKPPMPPPQSHPQPPMQPPTIPPHSQSAGSLQFQAHLPPQGLGPNAQAHVQVNVHGLSHSHSMPPPYKINTEDLNKEDVIFF